jgi:hypothetical protein
LAPKLDVNHTTMTTPSKRRQSSTEVFGSELREEDLHFFTVKNQVSENPEFNHLEQDYQTIKDHFGKLKFTFGELEMKRLFLEYIKNLGINSFSFPTEDQLQELEQKVQAKKNELSESKKQTAELKKYFTEQVDKVIEAYNNALEKKKQYEKKWDEEEEEEEMLRNWSTTEVDIEPAAEEQTLEPVQHHSEQFVQTIMQSELQKLDLTQSRQQINKILGWISGIEVLDVTTFPSKLIYKLRLTTYTQQKEEPVVHTCVTVWFDRITTAPTSSHKRDEFNNSEERWEISVIKVQGEHNFVEGVDGRRFNDILEYAVETNDLSFLLREIHARVKSQA